MDTISVRLRPVAAAVAVVCRGLAYPVPTVSVAAAFGAGALPYTEGRLRRVNPNAKLV